MVSRPLLKLIRWEKHVRDGIGLGGDILSFSIR